jgi:hypothetical protein
MQAKNQVHKIQKTMRMAQSQELFDKLRVLQEQEGQGSPTTLTDPWQDATIEQIVFSSIEAIGASREPK